MKHLSQTPISIGFHEAKVQIHYTYIVLRIENSCFSYLTIWLNKETIQWPDKLKKIP